MKLLWRTSRRQHGEFFRIQLPLSESPLEHLFCGKGIYNAHHKVPAVIERTRLGQLSQLSFKGGGTYQKIDGAAHAVVAAVIAHHGAVVEETDEESLHQGDEVLHL